MFLKLKLNGHFPVWFRLVGGACITAHSGHQPLDNFVHGTELGERIKSNHRSSNLPEMHWSKRGAQLMLQIQTKAPDGTVRTKFEQWHPALKLSSETEMVA